jgi:acetyl esterase/lipase
LRPIARLLALAVVVSLAGGLRADQAKTSRPKSANQRYPVTAIRDIVYYRVKNDPDRYRHQLDVYRPRGKKNWPVVQFLHGGGWVVGKKDNYFGLYGYGTIAHCLAERGLVVVLPNYRLSPAVRHPEHIKDVARAFAWTCRHVAKYGGDPKQIFVGGHSAGGHLAALLATDPRYVKDVGRNPKDIRGVIGISGVYRVDNLDLNLSLTGPGGAKVMRAKVRPLAVVFGDDPKVAREASPLTHVRKGLPPFLLVNAGYDYSPLKKMAREFAAALKKKGCRVEARTVPGRTHETVVFAILRGSAEPATLDLILEFVRKQGRKGP